jgi:acyl dehydratase
MDGMTHMRTLIAFNTATESENKIHDDAVASRFGFTGGLVPGVDVFAYLAHAPMAAWGRDWLAGGHMRARFTRPVYDGDPTTVESDADGAEGMVMRLSARGEACAAGSAKQTGAPAPRQLLAVAGMPAIETRPKASMESLKVGTTLGTLRDVYTREVGLEHIAAVRDDATLYDDGRIANAAWLLRRANYVLADNVKLGPWIHVESTIDMHSLLMDGEALEVRAVVADNTDSKGHLIVTLDVQMLSGARHVMSCRHWAIYEPRQVRERA